MSPTTIVSLLLAVVFWSPLPAAGITLTQAWFMALDNDPDYLAAVQDKLAGEEYISIGRAGLLPTVSLSYQRAPRNWQKQQYRQTNLQGQHTDVVQHQQYQSYSGSVTLVQPLFDYEAYSRYRMGIMRKLQSDERYRGELVALQTRLVDAWLALAEAQQRRQLSVMHRQALEEQQRLIRRQYSAGEGTVTDTAETDAALSLAVADESDAQDTLETARDTLAAIIGADLPGEHPLPLLVDKPLRLPLASTQYRYWEQRAFAHNPDILASGHDVEARRYEIESNRAGHLPQVQLYAMHSQNDSGNDNTVHQKYRTDSIGLRVSMDIFSGGRVSASTRQAAARYEQAQHLHDAQSLKTINAIKKSLNKCLHGPTRIAAYRAAVVSASKQVEATRKSILVGQRMNIDLLTAEQTLYKARVELSAEKHAVIKAWFGLLAQTGEVTSDNIMLLDKHFAD
ncbi:TolC family outer membrane protein [Shimwellia pseudoproteus]|uniref:TolC family outer membrane protein n=1 Tax=Shimwellia pseudoproteus TaxID=570012 RepID=UPI0018EDDC0D|nr:TolC family outer membrane protein [Shimwellia pseudoproteus]MBJ3816839.1 TolC family outer membrane protein [Shimwellia pseudoproteus]